MKKETNCHEKYFVVNICLNNLRLFLEEKWKTQAVDMYKASSAGLIKLRFER